MIAAFTHALFSCRAKTCGSIWICAEMQLRSWFLCLKDILLLRFYWALYLKTLIKGNTGVHPETQRDGEVGCCDTFHWSLRTMTRPRRVLSRSRHWTVSRVLLTCSGPLWGCSSGICWCRSFAWCPWSCLWGLEVSPAPLCSSTSGTGNGLSPVSLSSVDRRAQLAYKRPVSGRGSLTEAEWVAAVLPWRGGSAWCVWWNSASCLCSSPPPQSPQSSSSLCPSKYRPVEQKNTSIFTTCTFNAYHYKYVILFVPRLLHCCLKAWRQYKLSSGESSTRSPPWCPPVGSAPLWRLGSPSIPVWETNTSSPNTEDETHFVICCIRKEGDRKQFDISWYF